jgi:hypothetical protein
VAVGDPVLVTLCSVFPSLCVPSVSAGNLATSPVPGTISQQINGEDMGTGLHPVAATHPTRKTKPSTTKINTRQAVRVQSVVRINYRSQLGKANTGAEHRASLRASHDIIASSVQTKATPLPT